MGRRAWWLAAVAVALMGPGCKRSSDSESSGESAVRSGSKPGAESAARSGSKPGSESGSKPVGESGGKPVDESGGKPVGESGDELVGESCDAALRAANSEVRRERLALRPTALFLARHESFGTADGRLLSACGAVPAYLREYLGFQAALIEASRGETPPEISPKAREEYRVEMKRLCGENGLAGKFPPERRAAEVGRRCGLPHPGMGVLVPLYHHLRSAGAQPPTAWRALELSLSDPPALPFDEPPMLDRLPAGTCDSVVRDGIAVRVSASRIEIATRPAVSMADGVIDPEGKERLEAWLREFTAGDFDEYDGWMSTKRLMVVADSDVPALALLELAELSPEVETWLLLRRPDADAGDPFAPRPVTSIPLRGPGHAVGTLRLVIEPDRARLLSSTGKELLAESPELGPALASRLSSTVASGGSELVDVAVDPQVTVAAMVDAMQPLMAYCNGMGLSTSAERGPVSWSVYRWDPSLTGAE